MFNTGGKPPYKEPVSNTDARRFVRVFCDRADWRWENRLPRPGYSWKLAQNLRLINFFGTMYLVGHRHLVDAAFKRVAREERHICDKGETIG